MARSILGAFVSGTRQVLVAQLIISVGVVALAGWALGVTNDLIRQRDRLQERVLQLEAALGAADVVVPPTAEVVNPPPPEDAYPPSVTLPPDTRDVSLRPAPVAQKQSSAHPERGFGQIFGELFAPAPPLRTVVLHARTAHDAEAAQRLAAALGQRVHARVTVAVMPARDPRESGYSYFDGRQNRAAAALMQQFHDIARRDQVAVWSAQLRGHALPAQGEFTADRLDIVLPPLPAPPVPDFQLQPIAPGVSPAPAAPAQPQTPPPTR